MIDWDRIAGAFDPKANPWWTGAGLNEPWRAMIQELHNIVGEKPMIECDRKGVEVSIEQDTHYLRSILRQLREIQSTLKEGPTLGGEVLADNIDWLDCYIDRLERRRKRK